MRLHQSAIVLAALALAACGEELAEADGEGEIAAAAADSNTGEIARLSSSETSEKPAAYEASGKPAATAAASQVDFGDDSGTWANDDECDDPRFEGRGMTDTVLLDDDIRHDATDCREAYERGELTLR